MDGWRLTRVDVVEVVVLAVVTVVAGLPGKVL